MSARYVSLPTRADHDQGIWPTELRGLPVHTVNDAPVATGIVDHLGQQIFRLPTPIGFLAPKGDR